MPNPWNPREMEGGWAPRPHAGDLFRIARIMGASGATEAQIGEHLQRVYGGHVDREGRPYTPQNIGRAAALGRNWGDLLHNLNNSPGDLKIPRQNILRNPELAALGAAYRFTVLIKFPGQNGGPDQYRTVIILSDTNLKRSEINQKATDMYRQIAEQYTRFRDLPLVQDVEIQIQLAERRT